jgi:hypothetical protein
MLHLTVLCRHYVNSLVQYTTGVERSTQHLKRHYFQSRHADRYGVLFSLAICDCQRLNARPPCCLSVVYVQLSCMVLVLLAARAYTRAAHWTVFLCNCCLTCFNLGDVLRAGFCGMAG